MQLTDISQPQRQSPKGIIVIFALSVFKFFKTFFLAFAVFIFSFIKKGAFANITILQFSLMLSGLILIMLVYAILKYLNFKFHVKGEDFHLSSGILNKENTVIPKSKIQNVYIEQNFIQQLIDVVSLNIETAGDKVSEIEINALHKNLALKIKEELFTKNRLSQDATETTEQSNVFFKASLRRLLMEGISQNHLKSFGLIASFVIGIYYEFEDLFNYLGITEILDNQLNLEAQTALYIILSTIFIMLFILTVSLLLSIILVLIKNFNLEVVEYNKTVEINKGLINKVSLSLAPSRIQNIVISTNKFKRYLDLYSISVQQAMTNKKQQKNFMIIALKKNQMFHLVTKLLDSYSTEGDKHKPLPYYKRILILRTIPISILANVAVYFIMGVYFWLINLLVLPVIILFVYVAYKKSYYKIHNNYITIARGFVDDKINVLELHKLQAIHLKQNFFQKHRKIASVSISTASKTVTIPYISESKAKMIYDYLLFELEKENKDWM